MMSSPFWTSGTRGKTKTANPSGRRFPLAVKNFCFSDLSLHIEPETPVPDSRHLASPFGRLPDSVSEVVPDVREEHVEIARSLQPRFVSLMLRDVSHRRALAEFCFNQLRLLSANMTRPTLSTGRKNRVIPPTSTTAIGQLEHGSMRK